MGAANIVYDKLKAAYAKNPIRFITRLKGYFNFTNDQVKALLTTLGINEGVVDNIGRLVLAAGKAYSKTSLFIVGKASIITNDVTGGNTPRLMVDETGAIVKYEKPQRLSNSTKMRSNLEKVL